MIEFILSLLMYFHLYYIQFNAFIVNYLSKRKNTRSVFIIGDDWSIGVGDYVRVGLCSGIGKNLPSYLNTPRPTGLPWATINMGVPGCTSDDWLPDSPGKMCRKNYWNRMVEDVAFESCEMVIVCLGSLDRKKEKAMGVQINTFDNLVSLCEELSDLGKIVVLLTVPNIGNTLRGKREVSLLNEELKDYIASNENVICGPDITDPKYRNKSLFQGSYLNSKGYNALSQDTVSCISTEITKIEWNHWSQKIVKKE
eukprot:TRINITY_DN3965_c0_g1_i1.p1 TRINITY_DN3965_c0_g1~~TRINITY_DN3965_c0_g1_i1.p1  ORF type:complete len:262 (-),score=57.06 TRINITY_DN3965_c0_g1_i1:995-1756(-)